MIANEDQERNIFENIHAVMLLIDSDTADIIDANPAAIDFYGYDLETITNMKITDINTLSKDQIYNEMRMANTEQRMHFIFRHRLANGEIRDVEVYSGPISVKGKKVLFSIVHDITERKKAEDERDKLINELKDALAKVKTLSGLIPICCYCQKIRDDKGYWNQVADYISKHSEAKFTHGFCPECAENFKKKYLDDSKKKE